MTTSLQTDHYELTMVAAALVERTANRPCVFSAFTRRLPPGADAGVVAGVEAALDAALGFTFGDEDLDALDRVLDARTLEHLADLRFRGDIEVVDEGELYQPGEPVLTVTAPFDEAVMLETVLLSHLNGVSGIAAAASAIRAAAGDRLLSEQGSRRVHPVLAIEAARAAWIGGFDSTSNLAAGARYGIPTAGTASHSWTLLHADDESQAFEAQLAALGNGTTLLVDTFDISAGIDRAVAAARTVWGASGPGAIRIDSGDLRAEAIRARAQLDRLGATDTRIMVSGEVDEAEVRRLQDAPVDGFGVGTNVVIAPSPGFVYKLVATEVDGRWTDVAKSSPGKATAGGRRLVVRGPDGPTTVPAPPAAEPPNLHAAVRLVTRTAIVGGRRVEPHDPPAAAAAARDRHRRARLEHRAPLEGALP